MTISKSEPKAAMTDVIIPTAFWCTIARSTLDRRNGTFEVDHLLDLEGLSSSPEREDEEDDARLGHDHMIHTQSEDMALLGLAWH